MTEKILVTGANGFIGSHLVEQLVLEGKTVRAFVEYNPNNSWGWLDTLDKRIISSVEVLSGDVRDPFAVKNAVQDCKTILHLAALIAIPYSYTSPASYIDTNVMGTLNVLEAAKTLGIDSFIHTSTSEVYGTADFVPMTEAHPLKGQSPYSATKIAADQLAYSYHASFDLPVTILRPFNTYGPRQSARAVIPSIITQISSGKSEISLGSLHPTRDFNYVLDTANGFLKASETNKGIGEVINLASNYEVSIGETVKVISEIMEANVEVINSTKRIRPANSEVDQLFGDNKKAKELLGWEPRYSGIEGFKVGIKKTVNWFSNPSNLSLYKSGLYNI